VNFEAYAILRGWNRDELERTKAGSLARPSVEVLSMLQSWCTFGFLEAACQQHFRSSDFITSENLFTTHLLRSFLQHKAKELRSKPDDELLPFLSNLADTQRTVHRWAVMLELEAIKTPEGLKVKEIASIIRVCTQGAGWYYSSANRHILTKRLTKKGWCPSTFEFLLRILILLSSWRLSSDLVISNPDAIKGVQRRLALLTRLHQQHIKQLMWTSNAAANSSLHHLIFWGPASVKGPFQS
jgi:hypothetical protein